MSFSDKDLRELKNDLAIGGVITAYIPELIDRLEAAEALIKETDDYGFSDKAIALHTAWRKEAGK